MKKNEEIILRPKYPISEIIKRVREDKAVIQKAISEGKESELKGKFKFVTSL